MTAHHSPIKDQALKLLGSGHSTEVVAAAVGVEASYVSQLLADEDFRAQVTELKYTNLQKHNERDSKLDALEDRLIDRIDKSLPMMLKPSELLNAFRVINGAARRGHSAPETTNNSTQIVQLFMPTKVVQQFTTNINNQVVQTGDQQLVTMQSGTLLELAKKGMQHVLPERIAPPESRAASSDTGTSSRIEEILDAL